MSLTAFWGTATCDIVREVGYARQQGLVIVGMWNMRYKIIVSVVVVVACALCLHAADVPGPKARLVGQHIFDGKGTASQGLALTKAYYYSSNATTICRFDTDWKLLEAADRGSVRGGWRPAS